MQEALRYNQQLQFCKQLQAAQQQLAADAFASDELLASLYAMGKFCATPACVLQQLAGAYPEVGAHGWAAEAADVGPSARQHSRQSVCLYRALRCDTANFDAPTAARTARLTEVCPAPSCPLH